MPIALNGTSFALMGLDIARLDQQGTALAHRAWGRFRHMGLYWGHGVGAASCRTANQTTLAQEEAGRRLGVQLARLERQQNLDVTGASIAHELNQPLAVILKHAQLLQRQQNQKDDPLTRVVLEDIVASSVKAGDIVKRIRTSN